MGENGIPMEYQNGGGDSRHENGGKQYKNYDI